MERLEGLPGAALESIPNHEHVGQDAVEVKAGLNRSVDEIIAHDDPARAKQVDRGL